MSTAVASCGVHVRSERDPVGETDESDELQQIVVLKTRKTVKHHAGE